MCDKTNEARPVSDSQFAANKIRDRMVGDAFGASLLGGRSKFRPFTAQGLHDEQRKFGRPEREKGFDGDGFEILGLHATALAERIEYEREQTRKEGRLDERANREFDLSRTALEECVMRARRGITS